MQVAYIILLPPALTKQTDTVGGGVQIQVRRMQQEYDTPFVCVSCLCLKSTQLALHHSIYSVSLLCKTLGLQNCICPAVGAVCA